MTQYDQTREALKLCVSEMCKHCKAEALARTTLLMQPAPDVVCVEGCETLRIAKAALALPRLNCEVGTPEEQVERFNRFCGSHPRGEDGFCRECPCIECYNEKQCLTTWAQMPYTEGGAK